jgi:hypothetical protein
VISRRDDPSPGPQTDEHRRARLGAVAGACVIVVALAAAVIFAWPEGVDARHLVDDVVAAQAEVDSPRRATLRDRAVPATPFSRRASAVGWRPVAIWDQEVHGRESVSVVWEKAGHRVVHSQVSGTPLGAPEGFGRTGRAGVLLYGAEGELRNVVTWTEGDHTVVLSGADLSVDDLYDLAGGPADR